MTKRLFTEFTLTILDLILLVNISIISKCKSFCYLRVFLSAIFYIFVVLHFCSFSKKTVQLVESKKELGCDLVASWSVQVGDLDQCIHLWRYTGGFEKIDLASKDLKKDPDFVKLETERGGFLRARHLQYLLAFSYWPVSEPRGKSHIYEMRSYRLKPGTMIEWG